MLNAIGRAGARLDSLEPVARPRQADQRRWRLATPRASVSRADLTGTELAISLSAGIAVPRLKQGAAGTNHFGPGGVLFRDGRNSMPPPAGCPAAEEINEPAGCSDPRLRFSRHSAPAARRHRRICDSGRTAAAHRAAAALRQTSKDCSYRSNDQIPTRRNPILVQMEVG